MKNKRLYVFLILCLFLPILFFYFVKALQYFNVVGEIIISALPLLVCISLIFQTTIFILLLRFFKQRWLYVIDYLLALFCLLPIFAPIYIYYYPVQKSYVKSDNAESVLSVFSANILYSNSQMDKLASTIIELSPDVVLLNELTGQQYKELLTTLGSTYPYSYNPQEGLNGYFSKLIPTEFEERVFPIGDSYLILKVSKNNMDYNLYGVHPPALFSNYHVRIRTEYMDEVAAKINLASESKTIVIGDYNMTPWVWGYKYFLQKLPEGFYNAGEKTGFYGSWSISGGYSLPITLIDHALISQNIKITYFTTVKVDGSDHMGLYIEAK